MNKKRLLVKLLSVIITGFIFVQAGSIHLLAADFSNSESAATVAEEEDAIQPDTEDENNNQEDSAAKEIKTGFEEKEDTKTEDSVPEPDSEEAAPDGDITDGTDTDTIVEEETDSSVMSDITVTSEGQVYHYEGTEERSSEELFREYVESVIGTDKADLPVATKRILKKSAGANNLTGTDAAVYSKIMEVVPLIANGERSSTIIEINVEDLGVEPLTWTAEELGVSSIVSDGSISSDAVDAALLRCQYDLPKIVNALLADNPFQFYWFDKSSGVRSSDFSLSATYDNDLGEYQLSVVGSFTISFSVSSDFADGEYSVDTAIGQSVQSVVITANNIIQQYAESSDYEKLYGYKREICTLVSYNDDAANGSAPYGNPWQILWVFDNDAETNVVCEGYAKAFKYLCDHTEFDNEIECKTVTGTTTIDNESGNHMWNIVKMEDGLNYLVDVTNCDTGAIGEPDLLFLKGSEDKITDGELETGYTIPLFEKEITYIYDSETLELYSQTELVINTLSYSETNGNSSEVVYMPSIGNIKVLFVIVDFEDISHSDNEKDRFLGSVKNVFEDFYERSSYGKLKIDADIKECTVARPRAFYEDPRQDGSNDTVYGRQLLLKEILHELDSTTDFSQYDTNNDGYIDGLYLKFAGTDTGWGNMWWSYTTHDHEGNIVDNKKISEYVFLCSSNYETIIHETGHLLGLVDYYDNRWGSSFSDNIAESTDVMFDGYGDHNAYSKYILGWIDEPIIIDSLDSITDIELRPSYYYPDAAIIYPNGNRNSLQFFVVEYVIQENAVSIKPNNYGGLRIWRVNSAQTEQRVDQIPLIQSVHCGNHGAMTALDKGHHYTSFFYTGDELSPYTETNSFVYADPYGSIDDFSFSGVTVSSINTQSETASCSIVIDSEPKDIDLAYKVSYAADQTLIFSVRFNSAVSVHNSDSINITCDGEEISGTTSGVNNNVELRITNNKKVIPGNIYTLTIPAGVVVSAYGKENNEIIINAYSVGFENETIVDKQAGISGNASPLFEFSDGTLSYFKLENNSLYLCQYEGEAVKNVKILDAGYLSSIIAKQIGSREYVLRFYKDGNNVTYIYNEDTGLQLIKEHDSEESLMTGIWTAGEERIIYNTNFKYRALTFDGEVEQLNTNIDTVSGSVYSINSNTFIYVDDIENSFKLLDQHFNEIKEFTTTGIIDRREQISSFLEDGENILLFSYLDNDFYVSYFDKDFSFIRKKHILTEDPIKDRIAKVYKTENGYIITGEVNANQITKAGGTWNVSAGKLWVFDSSFNMITSYTDLESERSTSFDNIVVTDSGSIIASNWCKFIILENIVEREGDTPSRTYPVIVRQPEDIAGKEGDVISVSLAADGEDLSYEWQTINDEGHWESIEESNIESIDVTVGIEGIPHYFRCLVKDSSNNIVSSRVLKVISGLEPPEIIAHPVSCVANSGEKKIFSVTAQGDNLSYIWEYSSNNGSSWIIWTGNTEPEVSVTASANNDGFLYHCIVSNDAGSVISEPARLTLNKAPANLETPMVTSVTNVKDGIKIAWSGVEGAEKYRIYYKEGTGSWKRLAETTGTSYTWKGAVSGKTYSFTLRCMNAAGTVFTSGYDNTGKSIVYIAAPSVTKLESLAGGVRITWTESAGAALYRIYYKEGSGGWKRLAETTDTSYTWTGAAGGKTYGFTVRCMNASGTSFTSGYDDAGMSITYVKPVSIPEVTALSAVTGGLQITWSSYEGAEVYAVYYKTGTGAGGWKKLTNASGNTYTWTGAADGTTYSFTVRAMNAEGTSFISGYNNTGMSIAYEALVPIPRVTSVMNVQGGIKIAWSPFTGAGTYRIFYKEGGGAWKKLTDARGTSYTWTGAEGGAAYAFTVRAMNAAGSAYVSGYDNTGKAITYVASPVITDLQQAAGGIRISWDACPGAGSYRIFVKTNGGGWKKLADTADPSYTWTGAVSGNTYGFTVRCMDEGSSSFVSGYDNTGVSMTFTE